jgi:hypothetical protein
MKLKGKVGWMGGWMGVEEEGRVEGVGRGEGGKEERRRPIRVCDGTTSL